MDKNKRIEPKLHSLVESTPVIDDGGFTLSTLLRCSGFVLVVRYQYQEKKSKAQSSKEGSKELQA
jgi:hypothetical protein